jgi:hypothetical protein
VEPQRFFGQGLGLRDWQENMGEHGSMFTSALEHLGATKIKRAGFKVSLFLLLGMSHSEIVKLMFGSFLAAETEFQGVSGKLEDVLLQLHGEGKRLKTVTIIAPMTLEQATMHLLGINNLELLLESKLLDTGVKDFRERIGTDCLFLDIDLFQENLNTKDFPFFLKEAYGEADSILTSCYDRLKSLRSRKG